MRILVIRRDNIGDLVCTTPLLAALRQAYPGAWIGVLANAYNAPMLAGNSDIDACFAYEKAKHRQAGTTRLSVWLATAKLLWRLRRMKLDLVLCASPGAQRFARLLGARRIVEADRSGPGHEAEITCRLLATLGMETPPGPLVLKPDPRRIEELGRALGLDKGERCCALHLSARKPRQRWPVEHFAALARRLLDEKLADRILLFWAPGVRNDPLHPGDDDKARRLLNALAGRTVSAVPTHSLAELIAGLALADAVICADGGAMHVAAALGKPIVCFFGNSSAERWHPWGVPYELLQPASHDVADIGVDEASSAFGRLMERIGSRL